MRAPLTAFRVKLFAAVAASGAAALVWEVLWQHDTSLALGISTYGTAITLASMMSGFALGGYLAYVAGRKGWIRRPLAAYAGCEFAIALAATLVPAGLRAVALLDTVLFSRSPQLAPLIQLLGTGLLLIPPAAAMGATIPILAACTSSSLELGRIYAVNTAGAVVGIMAATFLLIPRFGVFETGVVAAAVEVAVGLWAVRQQVPGVVREPAGAGSTTLPDLWLGFLSGFAVFCLEVSWFRSVRAAYQSTTETFAIVLAGFLLPLALGAWLVRHIRSRAPNALSLVLPLAGFAILCATPWIDRLDRFAPWGNSPWIAVVRFALVLAILSIPVTLMGLVFPWLLDRHATVSGSGRLYAANTIGAVSGALAGAFAFLPSLGATRTSWLIALSLLVAGPLVARRPSRPAVAAVLGALGMAAAIYLDSGAGRIRVQGGGSRGWGRVLFVDEGPDATVSVVESKAGARTLVIDGFDTANENRAAHYMEYMGHLPALAVPELRNALVICFGTGQTANAVRKQGPARLDIVDVNPAVFRAAPLFPSNGAVLDDPRVRRWVMDGRAYLRRGPGVTYDLVTLEPMAPMFAGTNNLYSLEFYRLVARNLSDHGIVAQWLPFHLVPPSNAAAIAATFQEVFPHARLFVDPVSSTGILVGGPSPWSLRRSRVPLDLGPEQLEAAFALDEEGVRQLSATGSLITDDNQLLAQLSRGERSRYANLSEANLRIIAALGRAQAARQP